jgi:hypothetical protein
VRRKPFAVTHFRVSASSGKLSIGTRQTRKQTERQTERRKPFTLTVQDDGC